jgi:hypothetical protein
MLVNAIGGKREYIRLRTNIGRMSRSSFQDAAIRLLSCTEIEVCPISTPNSARPMVAVRPEHLQHIPNHQSLKTARVSMLTYSVPVVPISLDKFSDTLCPRFASPRSTVDKTRIIQDELHTSRLSPALTEVVETWLISWVTRIPSQAASQVDSGRY